MIKTNDKKSGFSLIEALVSMLILSLFFMASSRVITQKQEVEHQRNPHGYYECYILGGQWQHRSSSGIPTDPVQTNNCVFEPPTGVNFVNVHYYDGSRYFNGQQVIMNNRINLGSPSGIRREGLFITNGTEGDAVEQNPEGEEGVWEFITYLKMTHPTSEIYKNWVENETLPASATFIAW